MMPRSLASRSVPPPQRVTWGAPAHARPRRDIAAVGRRRGAGIIRKIKAGNPQENSRGPRLPAPDQTGFRCAGAGAGWGGGGGAAGKLTREARRIARETCSRPREQVRRHRRSKVPPSHPRVPVIDSSDGRFVRKCFRVRRFRRLRASARACSSPGAPRSGFRSSRGAIGDDARSNEIQKCSEEEKEGGRGR